MKNKSLLMLVASFLLAPQAATFADKKQDESIFKCINSKGAVYYNDKPCPEKDKETRIRAVKDPVNRSLTKTYSKPPVFGVKKQKKVSVETEGGTRISKSSNNQNKLIEELDGADAMLKAESERAERVAGASDADERRAAQNDRYNNPPKGSQKPLGSGVNVIKLTEKMAIARMQESADK